MTNARKVADGPVHRRYCGECGTRIDQLCPKCYTVAQPEPPKGLREAVEKVINDAMHGNYHTSEFVATILAAVGPVVEAREEMIRRLINSYSPKNQTQCKLMAEAQALIGGDDG